MKAVSMFGVEFNPETALGVSIDDAGDVMIDTTFGTYYVRPASSCRETVRRWYCEAAGLDPATGLKPVPAAYSLGNDNGHYFISGPAAFVAAANGVCSGNTIVAELNKLHTQIK